MHIRFGSSTLCALAAVAIWWASPSASVPATGRIVGTVTLWHERIGENITSIDVTPGGTASVTFVLPIDVR